MEIKDKAVFLFDYSTEYRNEHDKVDLNWCFDGKLVAEKQPDGTIILYDTYWTIDRKHFTPEVAEKIGKLTFLCNLNDVVGLSKHELCYYDKEDIIDLRTHNGYQGSYVVKKGTKRSKEAMLSYLKEKIKEEDDNIERAQWHKVGLYDTIRKIENGEDIEKMYI